jgi:hypothetical protein
MTTFTTGALPAQIPVTTISGYDAMKAQPGWTLMNVQKATARIERTAERRRRRSSTTRRGKPVWYFIHGTRNERGGAISVDRTDQGVLIGPSLTTGNGSPAIPPIEVDWAGNTLWTCSDPLCGVPDQLSHHAGKLSNGNHIVMRDVTSGSRTSQVFIELSPSNQMVRHHRRGRRADAARERNGRLGARKFHHRSISRTTSRNLSFRWLGVAKMKYSTKALIWHLPAKYGQTTLGHMFRQHDVRPPTRRSSPTSMIPEIHADGTILFFDNGGFSGVHRRRQSGKPPHARGRIPHRRNAKKATLLWEWPGSFTTDAWYKTQLYVPFWGDADRLANGNVLIAAGRRGTAAAHAREPRHRVTRDNRQRRLGASISEGLRRLPRRTAVTPYRS